MINVGPMPPKEALEYFGDRVPITAEEFTSLEEGARSRAFTVSGLARRELVEAVHATLYQALEEGASLQEARKRLRSLLTGGEGGEQLAPILKRHRLDTIIRTNAQTAYQAGRWRRLEQLSETRPYLRYSAVRDNRTRPEHAALHGLVYPADHDFWGQYYPPNGVNCRCTVVSLSAGQVERKGYEVQQELPGPQEWTNLKTGEVKRILPAPDPGFGRNAGKDWLTGLSPRELDGELTPLPCPTLCKDGKGVFAGSCKLPLSEIDSRHIRVVRPGDLLPKEMSKKEQVETFLRELGVDSFGGSTVLRLPGNYPLVVDRWLFTDKRTGELKGAWRDKGQYMRLLAWTLRSPYEVWWDTVTVKGDKGRPKKWRDKMYVRLKCISLFRRESGGDIGGYASFSLFGPYWHGATAFSPRAGRRQKAVEGYLEQERQGVLLYRETLR